jgi:cobalt-precorrin 5A hydrolase
MASGKVMIVAGIGCRRGAPCVAIELSIEAALAECRLERSALNALATAAEKGDEPGLRAAAGRLSLPLILVAQPNLALASHKALSFSQRVLDLKGVPSIAETAAIAAAGRDARLLAKRVSNRDATCAIAIGEGK